MLLSWGSNVTVKHQISTSSFELVGIPAVRKGWALCGWGAVIAVRSGCALMGLWTLCSTACDLCLRDQQIKGKCVVFSRSCSFLEWAGYLQCNQLLMSGGILWANDPCAKPQVYGARGDPGEAELTPPNDSSDSTSGNGRNAISVGSVWQKTKISVSRLSVPWCLSPKRGYACKN